MIIKNTATIFNIQHMCIHDGPGIRTTVFLKGCPLKCLWCANPESQILKPELLYNNQRCTGCGSCVKNCPNNAVIINKNHISVIDRSLCRSCGKCVEQCPVQVRSVSGEEKTIDKVLDEILKDKMFYGKDGGITISGGEPLMHSEFCSNLLSMCKENKIHTAIETTAFGAWEQVKTALSFADLVLLDIKEMNVEKHIEYTGVSNKLILENAEKISTILNKPIIARIPIIPRYNDSLENMRAIAEFILEKLPTCIMVNLLPYHNMGTSKEEQLGWQNEKLDTYTPTEKELEALRDIFRSYNIEVK